MILKTWALSIIAPAIAVSSLWRLRFLTQEPIYCSITAYFLIALNWSQISANLLVLNSNYIFYEDKKEADIGLMIQMFNQGSISSDIYQGLYSQLWSWTNFDYKRRGKTKMWKKKTCPKRLERRFSNCISYVLYFVKRIGYSYHFQVYRVIEEGRRATAEETVANSNNNFPIANRVGYISVISNKAFTNLCSACPSSCRWWGCRWPPSSSSSCPSAAWHPPACGCRRAAVSPR